MVITVNPQLQDELLKIKSGPAIRLVLLLNKQIAESETEICKFFKKNQKTMRKIAMDLESIVDVVRSKSSKEIFYVLNKRFFDIENTCTYCKHLNIRKDKIGVDEIKTKVCIKKGKPCAHKHRLSGNSVISYLKSSTEKTYSETYNRNIKSREYRHVDEWIYKDFASFYAEEFKENYPNLIPPETNELRSITKSLMKIFRENEKKQWRRLLKRYIIHAFQFYAENQKVITPFDILSKTTISSFLNGIGKKIRKVQFCEHKNIYCSFMLERNCSLNGGKKDCTDSITETMRKKFN